MISLVSNFLSNSIFTAGLSDFFNNSIYESFLSLCIAVDSIIYSIISWLYTIFIAIAEARIFTTETIASLIERLYLIIGIIGLFFAAYIFLTIIINPDNISKGNSSPAKLIRNVVLGIVSLVFIPTIFNFAYSIQGAVIDQNVIPRLFFASSSTDLDQSVNNFNEFGVKIFEGSFYVKDENDADTANLYAMAEKEAIRYNEVRYFSSTFTYVKQGKIQYNFIISGIIGIAMLIILVSYCIDIAVRSVKLAFLQIFAPFPSLLMMIPGQEKVFKKWLSETLKAFFEIFAKIALLVFGIFLIQKLQVFFEANKATLFTNFSADVVAFAKLFLIMGVIIFLRKAPKLLEEIFGFKTENPFNLKKRFDESGITALAGAVGGAVAGAYSSVKGAKARGGNQGWAAASGMFHGARLGGSAGWKGSLKGIGNAYNYGWANQAAWSHMDPDRGVLRNGVRVAGEMLRDNFGMQSYYEDLIDQARIKHDVRVSRNDRKIQNLESQQNQKARELESEFKFDERNAARENFMSLATKSGDTSKSEILKDNGKVDIYAPQWDANSNKYVIEKQSISANAMAAVKKNAEEAVKRHDIDNGKYEDIMNSLDKAEKMLGINFDSKTLLAGKRDEHYFDGKTKDDRSSYQDMFNSFVNSYVENAKQQLVYDSGEFKDYKKLTEDQQNQLKDDWTKAATDLFDQIAFIDDKDDLDYVKTNISHYNELMSLLDQATLANGPADDRGYIRDAAGQKYDEATGKFVVDDAVKKISEKIDSIVSGLDISKAVKSVKNQDVIGERNAKYRTTNIKIGNDTYNMAQISQIVKSLRDENAKLAKELETIQLAYQSDKQTSEAARKIGGLGKPKS